MRNLVTPSALVARLHDPKAFPHPVVHVECVETHISWVLLTGDYAYKIKKPVALGFLDFSTLPLRHAACLEELRLNRRLAPQLYVDVVPIVGPVDSAMVCGAGEPIEYAVRMHQFERANELDRLLDAGRLEEADIARAAERIARFHDGAPRVDMDSGYGTNASIKHPVEQTLRTLGELVTDAAQREMLGVLATWSRNCFDALETTFAVRRQEGFVRECHGDLHLGNLVHLGDDVVPFDCIEFSAELRWIDVISDVGFLMMDLLCRSRTAFAFRLINAYLETRGDYAGVAVLRYYLIYRALVRAMVSLLRTKQLTSKDTTTATATAAGDAEAHLRLAHELASPPAPVLFLMHGFSGSGKTYVSERLMQRWPAIRIRSDVERKRLLGLTATQTTRSGIGAGAYSQATNQATYQRLHESAVAALAAGFSVIVDSASLQHWQRRLFRELAIARHVRFVILDCEAPTTVLRRRLHERMARGADASEADESVLDQQLQHAEPLDTTERAEAVIIDPGMVGDAEELVANLSARLGSV